jgi:hypothetical protein
LRGGRFHLFTSTIYSCLNRQEPIKLKDIKALVLAIVPAPQSTPDGTPVAQLRPGPDAAYILATDCMNHSRFQLDGLWAEPNYFTDNGQTFGEFYKCIACCYSHPRP